jgi:hypothetical protein
MWWIEPISADHPSSVCFSIREFLRVFARFHSNEFPADSSRIDLEQLGERTRKTARKRANASRAPSFLGLIRGHPPHPR